MLSEKQLFFRNVAQTSDSPLALEIVKAKGVYLFDKSGKRYVDLISGISVSNIGHSNKNVKNAVKQQINSYSHLLVYGEFILSPQVRLAEYVISLLPKSLDSVYFVNSGSEAVEGALKLAKRFTGKTKIISCINAYHGSSHGALSVMGNEYFKNSFRPLLPLVEHIRFGFVDDLNAITRDTACVIIEPVQAEAGVQIADKKYFSRLRKKCSETGTLLIFDEVQTGCGRTGTMFAFEQLGIIPDILVLAKAFGAGMPLGAFIASKKIMHTLTYGPELGHITTFGGHPVSCAASLAGLKELTSTGVISTVSKKRELFINGLKHRSIKEVRAAGLLIAVELDSFSRVRSIVSECIANGVIVDWFLFAPGCLRIAPPLIITEKQVNEACRVIINAIEKHS